MGKPKEPTGNERGRLHNYSRSRNTKSRSLSSELALYNFPAERVSRSVPPYPLISKYSDHSRRAYKNRTLQKRGLSTPYGKSQQLTYRRNLTKKTLRKQVMQSQSENHPNMEVQEGNSQEVNSTKAEEGNVSVEGTSNENQKLRGSQRLLKDEKGDDKISSKEQEADSTKPVVKQSTSTEDTNGTKCKLIKLHAKTEVQKTNENLNSENENISTKTRAATRLKQEIVDKGDANGSTENTDIPENEESPHTRSSRSATKVHRENKTEETFHESQSSNVTGQSEKLNKLKNEKTPAKNLKKDQKDNSGECKSAPLPVEKLETPIHNVPDVSTVNTGNESDRPEDSGTTNNIATEKTSATKKLPKVTVLAEKLPFEMSNDEYQNVSVDSETSRETPKDTKRKSKRIIHPDKSSLDMRDDGPESLNVDEIVHEIPKDIKRKSKRLASAKDEKEVAPGTPDKSSLGSSSLTEKYSSPRIISSRRPIHESLTKERNISRTVKKSEEMETNLFGIESESITRKNVTLNSKQDDSFEVKRQSLKRKADAEFSESNKKSRPTRGLDSSSFFSIMSSPLQMLSQKEDPVTISASKIVECDNPCDIKMTGVEDDLVAKCDVSSQQIIEQKDKKWCLLM